MKYVIIIYIFIYVRISYVRTYIGQVTYVQVEPYSSGFNVTWDGTETELYEILYSATNDSLSATSVSTPVNVTSVVVGRLLPGTLYYVWVNETSTNTLSDVATVTTYSGMHKSL